jgi:NAD(P)-dependent dehydrogenase (short-subunit alcohol dehydrogenase family)
LGSVSVRDGIRVISLNLGPMETERLVNLMKKKAQDRTGSADNWRELFKPLPFGRGCAPDEVGAMIAFLASERCSYNSGSVVTIDAGLSARTFNF